MPLWNRSIALLGLTLLLTATGCTYVNIPAVSGDVASHDPNHSDVLKVNLQALRALEADRPPAAEYRIVLPAGTSAAAYQAVVSQVSDKAIGGADGTAAPAGAAVVEARQVRIRWPYAQVDLIRPAEADKPEGLKELVTVYLKHDIIAGWHVTRLRPWRIPLEAALVESIKEAHVDIKGP